MSYSDFSNNWVLDQFLTFLQANQLGANDKHIVDNFSVEHNWNASTINGTHKTNSITGSSINTTPASTGSQSVAFGTTWTPTVGVYQMIHIFAGIPDGSLCLQLFISAAWKTATASSGIVNISGIMFFDGTNMRLSNNDSEDATTVWYQKF